MPKWKPKVGENYYVPCVSDIDLGYFEIVWEDYPWHEARYAAGLVCQTEEEALEITRKMLAVARERVENIDQ